MFGRDQTPAPPDAETSYAVREATEDDLLAIIRLHHEHSVPAGDPPPDNPSATRA